MVLLPSPSGERRREYDRVWARKHPGRRRQLNKAWAGKQKELLRQYKLSAGCARCGYRKSAFALDMHHKDAGTKSFTVGEANHKKWSFSRIRVELDKCEVLCRNCHAEEHEKQRALPLKPNGSAPVL